MEKFAFAVLKGDARHEILVEMLREKGFDVRLADRQEQAEDNEILICPKKDTGLRPSIRALEYAKREDYLTANAVITAENALEVAMTNLNHTLNKSRALVIGYGRIGKALLGMLRGIGCIADASARKGSDLELIAATGAKALKTAQLGSNLSEYSVVFNTVPYMVLDEERLWYINSTALIIDLASKPGGLDFEYAESLGIRAIHALALPGKMTAKSAAQALYNTIFHELNEEEHK